MPSTGYTSSARMSTPPGAYLEVPAAAFGVPIPGVFVASDVGSGGSLNANGFLKITWITANGESLPSAEVSRRYRVGLPVQSPLPSRPYRPAALPSSLGGSMPER